MSDRAWLFPWPEPRRDTVYGADDGPAEMLEFEFSGARFRVTPTDLVALTSGRVRFQVECVTCGVEVHPATTGTSILIEQHAEEAHGWRRR